VIPQVFVFVACWSVKPFPMLTAQGPELCDRGASPFGSDAYDLWGPKQSLSLWERAVIVQIRSVTAQRPPARRSMSSRAVPAREALNELCDTVVIRVA
jgi:hypothetical protein